MKGDFSRLPGPGGRYSGVWMQQGRVQLDQDWNEQLVIEAERSRTAMKDLVGASGAPWTDPGFLIRARGGSHHTVFEADLELDVVFPGGELTVEVRVVVEETDSGGVIVEVDGLFVLWIDGEGRPAFQLGTGEGAALGSPEPLPRGTPVLLSAAYDGRVAVLHLDGRPVAAAPVRHLTRPAKQATLRLGGTRGDDGQAKHFGGSIDEVRIWDHARTPAQVREAADRSLTGNEEGLAAYYPLDEGEGAEARDQAGKRHAKTAPGQQPPQWKPQALTIGSGRLYVEGIPLTAPEEVAYDAQPDYPDAPPLAQGRHLLYVDVWERYLSASEDPALREVALGGLDTTGRTRTIWQVKPLPLGEGEKWKDAFARLRRGRRRSALAARRTPPDSPASGNRLYRVEIFSDGGPYGWPRPAGEGERAARVTAIDAASGGGGTLTLRAGRGQAEALVPGQTVEIFTPADDQAKQPGTLAVVTAVDEARHRVTVDSLPTGLEVSDEPRVRAIGTFLWSDDNAWLAYPVRHLERATGVAVLGDVGPEGLQLHSGDLVELTDDHGVLLALPGVLRTVKDVDRHAESVTLDAPLPPGTLAGGRILMRRWARAANGQVQVPISAGWTPLSDGVEVRFEGPAFRAADYWTIPMRVAAPTGIEWPQVGKRAAALPPQGIDHRYAALATVTVHPHHRHHDRHRIEVEDHRRIFAPLTSLTREVQKQRHHHHHHDDDHHHDDHDHHHHDHGHDHDHDHHHHHGEDVDVDVTLPDGTEVEVEVDEHGHHHHHEEVEVDVQVDGDEIDVTIDEHGRHHDEEITITVREQGVPRGCWVFGESPDAPDGFAATGARLTLPHTRPKWHERAYLPAPLPGRVRTVALGGSVYAFADGTRQVLRYDPVMDAWWPETQLPEPWRRFAVATLNGRIHLVGGTDANDNGVDWHRAYDPESGRWEKRAVLRRARWDLGAASLEGMLYAAGGIHSVFWFFSVTSDDLEAYDPDLDAWTGLRGMHHGRSNAGVAAAAGRLYAVGGRRHGFGTGTPSDAAERYDPATDRWKELDPVPTPRLDAALAELDGVLYLAGGDAGDGPTNLVEAYAPGAGWREGIPMEAERTRAGLAGFSGRLLSVGGVGIGGPTASVEECRLFFDLHGYRRE